MATVEVIMGYGRWPMLGFKSPRPTYPSSRGQPFSQERSPNIVVCRARNDVGRSSNAAAL